MLENSSEKTMTNMKWIVASLLILGCVLSLAIGIILSIFGTVYVVRTTYENITETVTEAGLPFWGPGFKIPPPYLTYTVDYGGNFLGFLLLAVGIIGLLLFLKLFWKEKPKGGEVNMRRILVSFMILGGVLFVVGFYITALDFVSCFYTGIHSCIFTPTGNAFTFIGAVIFILTSSVYVWQSSWWSKHGNW